MLVLNLGEPPTHFTWTRKDAQGKPVETKEYTPQSFYNEYIGKDLKHNYVMLMNDPSRDYYKLYEIDFDRHTYDGENWTYVNLPIEDIKGMAIASIKDSTMLYFSWRYGLLTAPSDFPIYKTDNQIKAERDSALTKFQPYYRFNTNVEAEQITKFRNDYQNKFKSRIPATYSLYIINTLQKLYKSGIVAITDQEAFQKKGFPQINLIENNVSQSYYSSDLFTIKTAYEFIINNCPIRLDKTVLQS